MHFYMDESGDLGFGPKSGPYFVLTVITTQEPKRLTNFVKNWKTKHAIPKDVELKGALLKKNKRKDFLKGFARLPVQIHYNLVNKAKVVARLKQLENILYNYCAGVLLVPLILTQKDATIIIDKRISHVTSGFRIREYLQYKVWVEEERPNIDLRIQLEDGLKVYALQGLDVISNVLYRLSNGRERRNYQFIEHMVKTKIRLFF